MSIFSGINNAKLSGTRDDVQAFQGEHLLEITQLEARLTEMRKGIFAIKAKVLASDNPTLKVGMQVDHAFIEGKFPSYFFRDTLQFLAKLNGKTLETFLEELEKKGTSREEAVNQATSAKQPYKECVIVARVHGTKISKNGKEYGDVKFYPAPESE